MARKTHHLTSERDLFLYTACVGCGWKQAKMYTYKISPPLADYVAPLIWSVFVSRLVARRRRMVCCDPISQHSLEPALCWSTCPFWPPTGPTLLLLWPPSSSLASGAKMTTTATIVLDSPASTAHQIKVFLPQIFVYFFWNACVYI